MLGAGIDSRAMSLPARRWPARAPLLARASLAALAWIAGGAGLARPASTAPPPAQLVLPGISVTPSSPAVDTLCELRVKIRNNGRQPASRFAFDVRVGDVPIPVYQHVVYFQTVPAGATVELRLYNFWSTEAARPAPADGQLRIRVELRTARWMTVTKDAQGIETSTPAGEVAGLPAAASLTVPVARKGG